MKKIFLSASVFLVSVITMFSCNNASTSASGSISDSSSKTENNMIDGKKIYGAIETGNMNGIDTLFTSDVVDHDGPMGMDVKGKDSLMKMLRDLHNHIKDLKMDVVSSAINGDYMFTLAHVTGTVADASMGKPGEKIDSKEVDVVKLKDNKMQEHWGFTDEAEMNKNMMAMQMDSVKKK